jgi:hypothetical protein
MDTGRARVEELSMKQPAYEKPEGSDAGVLLTAEEAVVEIEVANPELLLSDAELLIVEDEPLSAEELLTEEDGLLAAEEEILDAGVELLSVEEGMLTVEAKDELLLTTEDELEGVPEGDVAEGTDAEDVLNDWLWLALSEEALLELVCDEAEDIGETKETSELD